MLSIVEIRVLGSLDIRFKNGEAVAFESVKDRALLAYLAVEGNRPLSRERIAALLWPERTDSSALANLRHTLSTLRSTLGERRKEQAGGEPLLFQISANTIQFNPGAGAWVDLNELERSLLAADQEDKDDLQARISHLSHAVQLYRGRFMESFSLKGCLEFEDWMLLRREHTLQRQLKTVRTLAGAYETAGDWEQALASWRQLLQLEAWDEDAHRRVMWLLAAHDQRNAALAHYERCCQVLGDELGVQPEEETRRLYDQIRTGTFSAQIQNSRSSLAASHSHPGFRLVKPQRAVFVGRQQPLSILERALSQASSGQGKVIFITGEAGSGKTSLAWEFANQAIHLNKDTLFVAGRCNAITGQEDPYQPFREIVQMFASGQEIDPTLHLAPELLRRLSGVFPEVVKILLTRAPELIGTFISKQTLSGRIETYGPRRPAWQADFERAAARLSNAAPAARSSPDGSIQNPFQPLTAFLVELARVYPLVIFLDDLQWADAGSISMLHYLGKRLSGSRVVLLGAYRPQDIAMGRRELGRGWERHPFDPVRLELQRVYGEAEIDLDQPEGMSFVNELVDIEPNSLGESFRQVLYQQTKGNPLFTLELLHSMQARGDLVRDASGLWVESQPIDWGKLPARVEAVIAERLGRISPEGQAILRAACVEGELFSVEVTARVLGQPESTLVSWLSGPLSREQQIVQALDVGRADLPTACPAPHLSRYRFSHVLFQKYLYKRLDPVEGSALHEAVGNALECLCGPAAGELALQLAWHYEQAGLYGRAVEYLMIAGRQAINLSAHNQANALYDRSLRLVERLPETLERFQLEIQVQLARGASLFATDGWGNPDAVRAIDRVVELWEKSGKNSSDKSILLALYFQADHSNAQNDMLEALDRVNRLLQMIDASTERAYQVLAYKQAGHIYLFSGQPAAAVEYLEKAISLYTTEDEPFLTEMQGYNVLSASQTWIAVAYWLLGDIGKARRSGLLAIEGARRLGHPFYLVNALSIAGAMFFAIQNEPDLAGAYAQEVLSCPDSENVRMGKILSETVNGWAQVKQGEYTDGLALMRKAIFEWKTTGARTMMPLALMLMADALSLADQTQAALDIVDAIVEVIQLSGRRVLEAQVYWLQGEILAREQRRAGSSWMPEKSVEACFEQAIQVARQQGARSLELRAAASLARVGKEAGQPEKAALYLETILAQFADEIDTNDLRAARELLADLRAASAVKG